MDEDREGWMLVSPPKNWREPVTIKEHELELLELVGARLNLVMTRDEERKKFYLGPADGKLGSGASTVTDTKEQGQDLPSTGLRFPSGWTTDVVSDSEAGPLYKAVDPLAAAPLIAAFPNAKVSEHFSLSEFRPGGVPTRGSQASYKFIRLSPALVRALEDIRAKAGEALHVTSSYRPPDYNREVGGVSNSTHIDGLAADIYCDGLSTNALYDICLKVIGPRGGVGYYPKSGFVHVDLRGYEARWSGT